MRVYTITNELPIIEKAMMFESYQNEPRKMKFKRMSSVKSQLSCIQVSHLALLNLLIVHNIRESTFSRLDFFLKTEIAFQFSLFVSKIRYINKI